MTIGKKLTLGTCALVAVLMIVSAVSLTSIGSLNRMLTKLADQTVLKLSLAEQIKVAQGEMVAAQNAVISYGAGRNTTKVEEAAGAFENGAATIATLAEAMVPLLQSDGDKELLAELKEQNSKWSQEFESVKELARQGQARAAISRAMANTESIYVAMGQKADRLVEQQLGLMENDKKEAAGRYQKSWWMATAMIAIALAVGSAVLFLVAKTSRSLRLAASELTLTAGQVIGAAGQVSSSSQALARGSAEQAASLEETSASTEEINAMARQNGDRSAMAASLVLGSQARFNEANQSLDASVAAMADISGQSEKISKIIKVIDEIAFQTNILALNAAVEAARAGEAGLGFAVVADEVRNLAQRCAQAASDTSAMIEESIQKSGHGKAKVDHVASVIRSITEESTKIQTLVEEVNTGSQEQTRGIDQISKAVGQMEGVTQSAAASAQQSAAAAEQLTAQAGALNEIVTRLTAMVGENEGGDSPSASRRWWFGGRKETDDRQEAAEDLLPMEADRF